MKTERSTGRNGIKQFVITTTCFLLLSLIPQSLKAQPNLCKSSSREYLWMYVGTPTVSGGEATYTSIAFSPAGQLYVAYTDSLNFQKATVKKFNGNLHNGKNRKVGRKGEIYQTLIRNN